MGWGCGTPASGRNGRNGGWPQGTALALYRGITRFLVEDTADWTGTRSALQRACRQRAYGVIQRTRAWGTLIAEHHPRAVRLSIHPQPVGAPKFGIRLLDAPDAWTTPWHSAALRRSDRRAGRGRPVAPGPICVRATARISHVIRLIGHRDTSTRPDHGGATAGHGATRRM
ncbi:hypothetical protein SY2F82_14350 [Streptomyces sp. Y2F8-2]|nr:hypothetical protein SY2F82_14350 [Streptomyces sp. Y2F8-2]